MDLFNIITLGCAAVSLLLIVAILVLWQFSLRQRERWLADLQAAVERERWPRRNRVAADVAQLLAARDRSRKWRGWR